MLCTELPKIMWFQNGNDYTECHYKFHYRIIPDVADESMKVVIWHGFFCYDKSKDEIVSERTFPMTAEGRDEMIEYIRNEDWDYRQ